MHVPCSISALVSRYYVSLHHPDKVIPFLMLMNQIVIPFLSPSCIKHKLDGSVSVPGSEAVGVGLYFLCFGSLKACNAFAKCSLVQFFNILV